MAFHHLSTVHMHRSIFKAAVFGVLFLPSSPAVQASTPTVQKCRSASGAVRYQSAPCLPGERQLAVWDATPEPVARPLETRRERPFQRAERRRAARPRASIAAVVTADRCQAAKERRDAIERQVGLARTYELLSALQRDVYDACR